MLDEMVSLVKQYTGQIGPSTYESPVAQFIAGTLGEEFHTLSTPHGHLIAHGRVSADRSTLVLQAHMDEVGFRPNNYLQDGFIELAAISSISHEASNHQVVFLPTGQTGILVVESGESPRYYADVGARDATAAMSRVPPYSTGAYVGTWDDKGEYLYGKSFDDRVGCAIVTYVLTRVAPMTNCNIVGLYTAREEGGGMPFGELTTGFQSAGVHPTLLINLEVCPGGPTPTWGTPIANVGEGVVLCHMDKHYPADPALSRWVTELAQAQGLAHQHLNTRLGGGESHNLAATLGCRIFQLCMAERYPHAPISVIAKRDLGTITDLVTAIVRQWESHVCDTV